MEKELVCIILINYNTYQDTIECVHSLLNIEYTNYKIILVENHSNDVRLIMNDAFLNKHCEIVYSDINGGFSYGNNLGIKYAIKYNPQYYLLLNNDTIVKKDFLKILVNTAKLMEKNCGLVTGKSCYYSHPDRIDFRGGRFDWVRGVPVYCNPAIEPKAIEDITFATGCMWLLPKITIDKVGMLDESFFMYAEDTDYCIKILKNGLHIYYCDDAVIYHKISASSQNDSAFKQYYMQRNKLYIIKQYSTNKKYAYKEELVISVKGILRGRLKVMPVLRAWIDFCTHKKGKSEYY